jgi:2-polyprenyl-3-methyl-5-hydroxy-6-metoxy-1,4-benzoquinol methylase
MDDAAGTEDPDYARRLDELSGRRWKRALRVQAPYERYLRRLRLGRTLEVGCGIGRNLRALAPAAVGVDHNATAVGIARDAGLPAFTPAQFRQTEHASPGQFDSLLASHVLEHLSFDDAASLIDSYLLYVRAAGRVVMITPQECGFASDATHRTFLDFSALETLARRLDLEVLDRTSFPFPRAIGHVFRYNEFVLIARRTTFRQ